MSTRGFAPLAVVVTLALTSAVPLGIGQQPIGYTSVSGIVLTTDDTPQPVRRAIVSMRGSDTALGHHAISDDEGRFEIDDLPAGNYAMSAKRPGFVTLEYGASRPEVPGTPLALVAGQRLTGLRVRMARGAVIMGTVRQESGAPESGINVYVDRPSLTGSRLFRTSGKTDLHGVYRIYGLSAGAYTVWVQPIKTSREVMYVRSDAEVDAILLQLQQGRLGTTPATSGRTATSDSPVSDFTPVYYPSAFTEDDAMPIVLAAGEERTGVDVTTRLMAKAGFAGRIVASDGGPVNDVTVGLVRASRHSTTPTSASVHPDGTFQFSAVVAGRYQVVARRLQAQVGAVRRCDFASADVQVTSSGLPDLLLTLKPCLKIAARVEVASDASPAATVRNLTGTHVRIEPDFSTGLAMYALPAVVTAIGPDGRFALGDGGQLMPGSYMIHAEVPGAEPAKGLWLESARIADGRDILDVPLTLTDSSPETTNVVLTFTDRHTSLSGTLETASRRPAIDYTVIAFTPNRDWWRPPFRRVLAARPATDGGFVLHDPPPGEYLLAALADVATSGWLDAGLLDSAARGALRVTIGPGEHKVQHLQIRDGGMQSR